MLICIEWVNPTHNGDVIQWSYTVDNGVASHQSFQQTQSEFNADFPDDAAHWGNMYWSTAASSDMTYQSGIDVTVRGNFLNSGVLPNTQDSNYRAISNNWPVFAFANALGNVGTAPVTTLYTIVHAQQNAIYFDGANGLQPVPSLWTSYFSTDLALVCFLHLPKRSQRLTEDRSSSSTTTSLTKWARPTTNLPSTHLPLEDKTT